ncbi:MAG: hypothetical protein QW320_05610 [Ignisphaera sp.]
MSNSISSGLWNVVISFALATISAFDPQNTLASLMLDVVGGFFSIAYEDLYNVLAIYNFSIAVFGHVYVILPHYLCCTMSRVY